MADCFTKTKRSDVMRAVRSNCNTSTELRLISIFKAHKITGWRRNSHILGHPDFVIPQQNIAIFTDGCFWHGHGCRNISPKTNFFYWKNKINRNKRRDKAISKTLKHKGWRVIRIWECRLRQKHQPTIIKSLIKNINSMLPRSSVAWSQNTRVAAKTKIK